MRKMYLAAFRKAIGVFFVSVFFANGAEAQNVGIGTNDPMELLDIRSSGVDVDAKLSISNSDISRRMVFFPGTQNDPSPFLLWSTGGPLRFVTDENNFRELMRINSNGQVGIGLTNPNALLHLEGGNFLISGDINNGPAIEFGGLASKMFFNPRKAAFRAGYVNGSQWDDANVGLYSIAGGFNAIAKSNHSVALGAENVAENEPYAVAIGRRNRSAGFSSLAMGHFSEATGDYSVSVGLRDTVTGFSSVAIGQNNKALNSDVLVLGLNNLVTANRGIAIGISDTVTAPNGVALGNFNIVSGFGGFAVGTSNKVQAPGSISIGQSNTLTGNNSVAIGLENTAGGFGTFAAGRGNQTSGNHSSVFGFSNTVTNDQAFAMGLFNNVGGKNAVAMGQSNFAPSAGELTIGNFATTYTANDADNINTGDRVFTIGVGTSTVARKDAMVVFKSGNISIPGNLAVIGTMSKGGGSFKIDHPLDPENKYLYHSFVESPDMMNVYNGNITTNDKGEAVVEMPEWFESLNKDFRYQLTVMGTFSQAIVSEKLKDNQFAILTDKPNVEVSWQITGIRHDAFAEDYRIPVEQAKTGDEIGKYLYPGSIERSRKVAKQIPH